MSNDISTIKQAVKAIKTAILQSQLKAAKAVNKEQLALYFGIGRYVSINSRTQQWGAGAIEQISEQLQKELPGLRGFGPRNIRYMRQFFEEWDEPLNFAATAAKLPNDVVYSQLPILQPLAAKLDPTEFVGISFSHHVEIMNKVKSVEERAFYIHQAYTLKWDKYRLRNMLKADLYHHQGALPNNFVKTLPESSQALRAIEMFKDEYLLEFINVEEIGERDKADIDERVVEQQIIHNVKNFIMTFGKDFTFVGNQYHLEKFNHALYPDLLFYNRELACLVAVELKKGEFKPSYLGQLSAYLRVLDDEVKKPFENPSIGIILCKSADKSFVEYLIQDYDHPMGVATYKTKQDIMKQLPSEDELRKVLNEDTEDEM